MSPKFLAVSGVVLGVVSFGVLSYIGLHLILDPKGPLLLIALVWSAVAVVMSSRHYQFGLAFSITQLGIYGISLLVGDGIATGPSFSPAQLFDDAGFVPLIPMVAVACIAAAIALRNRREELGTDRSAEQEALIHEKV